MASNIGLRWGWAIALAIVVVVVRAFPSAAAADPDRAAAAELLAYVNADRIAAGLAPLSVSSVAVEVAEAWSQYMADLGDLAHNDAWFSAETKQRAGAGAVGENVATNVDLADAHRRLMNSPGHRANILDPRFHQVGIGVVRGPTGAWWITEDFLEVKSAPTVVAPAPPPPADPTNPPPAPAPPPPAPPPARAPAPPAPAAAAPAPEAPRLAAPAAPAPTDVRTAPDAVEVASEPAVPADGQELAAGTLARPAARDVAVLSSPLGAGVVAIALAVLFASIVGVIRFRRAMVRS